MLMAAERIGQIPFLGVCPRLDSTTGPPKQIAAKMNEDYNPFDLKQCNDNHILTRNTNIVIKPQIFTQKPKDCES